MKQFFIFLFFILLLPTTACTESDIAMQKELIVLAAPISDDLYYQEQAETIFQFHIGYVKKIQMHDQVLVLVDEGAYQDYVNAIGDESVVIAPMEDIWMRDFSLSNVENAVMFRYSAEGQGRGVQGQQEADAVQEQFADILDDAGLQFIETDLINDGGNFVDDYAGNAVISRKFLYDNKLTESQAKMVLKELLDLSYIAFIDADEQGGLEHADGVVSFVDENTLIVNSYEEDPDYAQQLEEDLRRGLPDVNIHKIVTPYDDSDIYDERFGSACGLYTNALVTPERIYFPQFGIPEDAIALEQVKAVTDREIIPVNSQRVCSMGGGVRCMSWQLRGENARKLLEYFQKK